MCAVLRPFPLGDTIDPMMTIAALVAVLLLSACGTPPRSGTPAKRLFLTSGTSWIVPTDWNSDPNTIEVVGGGGGAPYRHQGGGGGGGAYSRIENLHLVPGAVVQYTIGG